VTVKRTRTARNTSDASAERHTKLFPAASERAKRDRATVSRYPNAERLNVSVNVGANTTSLPPDCGTAAPSTLAVLPSALCAERLTAPPSDALST
jgi:hypothetical protein